MKRLSLGLASLVCAVFVPFVHGGEEGKTTKKNHRAQDGVNIVYEVRGKGDTALIFLHGWCGDRHWWKQNVDAFAKDYVVIGVDQAGHGESGKDREKWTVEGLGQDVETLVKELGLKRVILIGHSMGGPVSLAAAKRLPGTVAAVIGVDTLHNVTEQWPEEESKKFLNAFGKDFKGTLNGVLGMMFHDKVDAELLKWVSTRAEVQQPKIAIAFMSDMAAMNEKTLMKEAKVPVRCINAAPGAGYKLGSPTKTEANKKFADFDVVLMEGVGHFPMLENPAAFNMKLREVLKEFAAK